MLPKTLFNIFTADPVYHSIKAHSIFVGIDNTKETSVAAAQVCCEENASTTLPGR